jgi:hypothetical protein
MESVLAQLWYRPIKWYWPIKTLTPPPPPPAPLGPPTQYSFSPCVSFARVYRVGWLGLGCLLVGGWFVCDCSCTRRAVQRQPVGGMAGDRVAPCLPQAQLRVCHGFPPFYFVEDLSGMLSLPVFSWHFKTAPIASHIIHRLPSRETFLGGR